jgi:predicted nucleic acid-binding protein
LRYVFDTEVILKFYLGEEGAKKVKDRLAMIVNGEDEGYVNLVNLTEFYYILHRKSPRVAEEKLSNLMAFGLKPVNVKGNWKTAAKIKAGKGMPLGDAFAAATALTLDATLLAGHNTDFTGLNIKLERV